jgi:hypothetical protein
MAKKMPGGAKLTEGVDAAIKVALNGAAEAIFMPAVASVSMERVQQVMQERCLEVATRAKRKLSAEMRAAYRVRGRVLVVDGDVDLWAVPAPFSRPVTVVHTRSYRRS